MARDDRVVHVALADLRREDSRTVARYPHTLHVTPRARGQFHVCVIIQALVHGCATKLASTSLYGVRIPASLVFYCARDMMLF